MKIIKYLFIGVLIIGFANNTYSQDFVIPDEYMTMKNPSLANEDNLKAGAEIYKEKCFSCHGMPGEDNNQKALIPTPPDFGSDVVMGKTPGEFYYVLTYGKPPLMAPYEALITEEDRWKIVSYLKSFDKNYVPEATTENIVVIKKATANIELKINEEEQKISAYVTVTDTNGNTVPFAGANVIFSVKRYFGNLEFDSKKANNQGVAIVDYPKDIPGDTTGHADLVASLGGDFSGTVAVYEKAPICTPHTPINIFEKRVLWSTNDKTQWWVILSYLGVVLGVWITIFYVIFQIVGIAKLSKN